MIPRDQLATAVSASALAGSLMLSILGSWRDYRDTPDLTGSQRSAVGTAGAAGLVIVGALAAAGGGWSTFVVGSGTVAAIAVAYGAGFARTG